MFLLLWILRYKKNQKRKSQKNRRKIQQIKVHERRTRDTGSLTEHHITEGEDYIEGLMNEWDKGETENKTGSRQNTRSRIPK